MRMRLGLTRRRLLDHLHPSPAPTSRRTPNSSNQPTGRPTNRNQPQRQYRRLLDIYGSLKSRKIGQLESLMEEQDRTLLAAAEVGRAVGGWRGGGGEGAGQGAQMGW